MKTKPDTPPAAYFIRFIAAKIKVQSIILYRKEVLCKFAYENCITLGNTTNK